eukprot:Nk52_evm2s252 gene=Nk52_evmTU2s252
MQREIQIAAAEAAAAAKREMLKGDVDVSDEGYEFNDEDEDDSDYESCKDYTIIRKCESFEEAELTLEDSLNDEVGMIILDNKEIGDAVASIIRVGNFIHKSSVLAGMVCLGGSALTSKMPFFHLALPAGIYSISCALTYNISWQGDPLCKYQVDWDGLEFYRVPLGKIKSKSPLILVRKDDSVRKKLHNTFSLGVLIYCGFKLYRWYKSP